MNYTIYLEYLDQTFSILLKNLDSDIVTQEKVYLNFLYSLGYFGIDWTGSANMRELHLMLEKGLMIRRLKSEVLTELPAKRR